MDLLEIFKTSILYIEDHLTDKISVKDVADHASVSNFYFQRMFSAFTGMNVGDYIRQRRLSLAAQELLIDDAKIIDLAFKYGYETPESFARAFRKLHGVLPNEVKKHPNQLKLCSRYEIIPGYDFEVYQEGDTQSPTYKSAIWIPVHLKR